MENDCYKSIRDLTGPEKAAILINNWDQEVASRICDSLSDSRKNVLTMETPSIDEETYGEIIVEFYNLVTASESTTNTGIIEYIRSILEKSIGTEKTVEVIGELINSLKERPLDFLNYQKIIDGINGLMFSFYDIDILDESSMQRVLKEVKMNDLAFALKGVPPDIQNKIFNSMPDKAGMLKDQLYLLGPVRTVDCYNARKKILNTITELEKSGDITIDYKMIKPREITT
jgi:flagellar motor switch protein FliG